MMISKKIKEINLQKRTKKALENNKTINLSNNKKILTVGILASEEYDKLYDLQNIVLETLEVRNPKLYSFKKFFKHDEKSFKHFTDKDFNWKADIIDSSLDGFLNEPFDLLLCFYKKPNAYLHYATALSKASFKVGFSNVFPEAYQLEIAIEDNQIDLFLSETKKYLTILQKL